MSLTGKTSIITGGSDGIGRAIAAKLASEGAHVVICARNAKKLESVAEDIRAAGGSVETRVQDVADTDSFAAMIEDVASSNGLDILVNNDSPTPVEGSDEPGIKKNEIKTKLNASQINKEKRNQIISILNYVN